MAEDDDIELSDPAADDDIEFSDLPTHDDDIELSPAPEPTPRSEPNATPIPADQYPTATKLPEDFYSAAKLSSPTSDVDLYAGPEHEIGPADKKLVREVGLPAALQIGAALATSGSSLPWQVGANVASGEVGRRIAGEEPWKKGGLIPFKDESGWLQDLLVPLAPLAVNTGVGITNSLAKPLLKVRAPELVEAAKDITKGWEELPKVEPSGATPLPILDKNRAQASIDIGKEFLGSPAKRGLESKIAELRDTAKRVDIFPKARNRINEYLSQARREIFTVPAEGTRGKVLRQRVEIPLADREDMKLLLEGHKTIDQVSPLAAERAPMLKQLYEQFEDRAREWGIINKDAPTVRARFGTPDPVYSGPNIPKDPAEKAQYLAGMTELSHEGKRTVGFHQRVEHKYFEPEVHSADALEGFDAYAKSAPEQFATAYAFGAPGKYTSLAETVEGIGKRPAGATIAPGTKRYITEREPGTLLAGEGSTTAYGRDVNELLNRAGSQDLSSSERAKMESLIGSLNQIYHTGGSSKATGVAQAVSTPLLGLSGLRQFKQAAWNVAKPGYQNFVEGITDYIRDPDVRAVLKAGGGGTGSLSHLFAEMTPEESLLGSYARLGASKLPSKIGEPLKRVIDYPATSKFAKFLPRNAIGSTIGWSENQLRSGPLAAGYLPYTEKLIQRASEAGAPGGRMTRGLARELREAGISEDDLRMGMLTHPNLTGRYQLMSGDPGQSSARLTGSEGGRIAGMFQNFPLGAARLFKSDIVDPMASGVRHLDPSEFSLGAGRLARYIPAGLAAGGAVAVGENLAKGRLNPADWVFEDVPEQMVSTLTGKFGDLGYAVNSARDKETGELDIPSGLLRAFSSQIPPIARIGNRPTWGQLGYHAASLLHPQAGSALSLLKPAIDEYSRRKRQEEEEFQRAISGR